MQQNYTQSRPVATCMSLLKSGVVESIFYNLKSNYDSIIYRNSFNKVISQHERLSCYYFIFDVQNAESNEAT